MMLSMLCLHWLVHCCVPLCASSMQGPHPHARPPNVPHTICTMCMHNAYAHTRTHYLASFGINRRPSPVRSVFSCANICVAFHLMGGSGTLKWEGGEKSGSCNSIAVANCVSGTTKRMTCSETFCLPELLAIGGRMVFAQ